MPSCTPHSPSATRRASDASSSLQAIRPPHSSSSSTSSRLPLELPVDNQADTLEQMMNQLQRCAPEDLRRARRHHRRALEALRNGCYEALCEDTRDQLIGRLQVDLDALNRALGDHGDTSQDVPAPRRPEPVHAAMG